MEILIVYYSRTQNTESIAKQIYEFLESEHHAQLLRISEKRKYHFLKLTFAPINDKYFSMVIGSPQLFLNTKLKKDPEIENVPVDLLKFDLLIIGSPIWYGGLPPAMNTFISHLKKIGYRKKALVFLTSGLGRNYERYADILKNGLENIDIKVLAKIHVDSRNAIYLTKENKKTITESIRSSG